jgi:hypothetical protein
MLEKKYNLPDRLLVAICRTESHWDASARGAHGEIGLCQIKPSTVKMFCPDCEQHPTNFHQGTSGQKVRMIQRALINLGHDVGTIDGVFGLKTHIAVTRFQKEDGLSADGIVGAKTWRHLMGKAPTGEPIIEQLKDPEKNMEYAARYLSWLKRYLETDYPDILAAAYNGGPANPTVIYMLKIRRLL